MEEFIEALAGAHMAGSDAECFGELGGCLVVSSLRCEHAAEADVRFGIVGPTPDRLHKLLASLIGPPVPEKSHPQEVARLESLGGEPYCLDELGDCPAEVTLTQEADADVFMDVRVGRIDPNGRAKVGAPFLDLASGKQVDAESAMQEGVAPGTNT
jgi:hypothetical protein